MQFLSLRIGRALAAVVLACGILAAAGAAQGLYAGLTRRPVSAASSTFARLEQGDLVGRIRAPRVGLDTPVYEGVDDGTLAEGAGHLPETPLPGNRQGRSNSVIAIAHGQDADLLARLRLGDVVEMRTPFGLRHYRVVERHLFDPQAIRFDPASRPRVTLLAPYPPEELGPAPARLALGLEE